MNNDEIRDGVKRKIVEEMAEAVKTAAKSGAWKEQAVSVDSDDAGQIARSAVEAAWQGMMGAGVPEWFSRAVSAAQIVLAQDELLGLDCVAALLDATKRADADRRPAALELLWRSMGGAALGVAM